MSDDALELIELKVGCAYVVLFWYVFPTRLAAIDPDLGRRGSITAAESLEA